MSFGIIGDDGLHEARVDDNKAIRAILYDALGNPIPKSRNDALEGEQGLPIMGAFMPGRRARFMRVDSLGTVRAADPMVRFVDNVDQSSPTMLYASTTSGMSQTNTNGVRTYNSASSTTSTNGYMDVTLQRFERRLGKPIRWRQRLMPKWGTTGAAASNLVLDFGFGGPATLAGAASDGCFFRVSGTGALTLVYAVGAAEATLVSLGQFSSGVIMSDGSVPGFVSGKSIRVDSYYQWEITLGDDWVFAQILDPETGDVIFEATYFAARTSVGLVQASHVAAFCRVYNSGTVATAGQILSTGVLVEQIDGALGMTLEDMLAGLQRQTVIGPTSGAQATNYGNSAAPSSGALSNTVPSYTTFGGAFQFAAVAGAETDYCLFGWTQPSLYRSRIRRIRIDAWVMGAAIATTPTTLAWALDFNATSTSLAAGSHYRETMGVMSAAVAAAIGQPFDRALEWAGNRVVEPTRMLNVIMRIPVGTATASQIIRGYVSIDGMQE